MLIELGCELQLHIYRTELFLYTKIGCALYMFSTLKTSFIHSKIASRLWSQVNEILHRFHCTHLHLCVSSVHPPPHPSLPFHHSSSLFSLPIGQTSNMIGNVHFPQPSWPPLPPSPESLGGSPRLSVIGETRYLALLWSKPELWL